MKPDRITVTVEITREVGADECDRLNDLLHSGDKVFGLVDTFSWMPFIVVGMHNWDGGGKMMATFELRMVNK